MEGQRQIRSDVPELDAADFRLNADFRHA
jgi:hypothetical protein